MGNFTHVANYITKAESTPDTSDAVVLTGQLKVAAGLAHLEGKKYKQAARKFLEASPELGTSFSDVMSQQDVATYGGLCALASYDRAELKAKLIDNSPFRAFLELVPEVRARLTRFSPRLRSHSPSLQPFHPPQVRELLTDFHESRYASCLSYLERLKPDLLVDLHLHDHVLEP